jgi:hypothetical protein
MTEAASFADAAKKGEDDLCRRWLRMKSLLIEAKKEVDFLT